MNKGDIHFDFKWLDRQMTHGTLAWLVKMGVWMAILYFLMEWGILTRENFLFVKEQFIDLIQTLR